MATAAQTRRLALRERLIELAEARIASGGLAMLRARDLAREAGCALGAIYNAVGDLNELVLLVNARTFARLGAHVAAACAPGASDPLARLITMAQAYHGFAADNPGLWRALFEIDRPAGTAAPDWYLDQMQALFALIDAPLAALRPDLPAGERALLTRGLFSAVHGIVLLSRDAASAGLPEDQTDRMLALILGALGAGRT